LFEDVPTE